MSWNPLPAKQKSWAVKRQLVDIDVDYRSVAAMLGATKEEYDLAVPRVINRELVSARARVAREVSNRLSIKPQKLVRRRLRIDRANRAHHAGSLRFLVRPVPFHLLTGVHQVHVKGGGVTAPGQPGYLGAFMAQARKTGPKIVFRRKGTARNPIEAIKIEIHQDGELIMNRVMDDAEDHSKEQLARELDYRISLRTKATA